MAATTPAQDAYEALAESYDALTADYDHERWLAQIERRARGHGLRGKRVLDVGCGTGKSFLPLLARGYDVTGCDISPAMLARAAAKAPDVRLVIADMRHLPRLGRFDLVTCLDDALNYVLDEDELIGCLRGMRRNLAPGGVCVFDVNTLAMYGASFAADRILERDGVFLAWEGNRAAPAHGACLEIAVHAFTPREGGWQRSTGVHRQRHWPAAQLPALLERAGLRLLELLGQRTGAHLDDFVDESVHTKCLVIAGIDRDAEEVSA